MSGTRLLVVIVILLVVPLTVNSQQSVQVDDIYGSWDDCDNTYLTTRLESQFIIRLTNINGTSCAFDPSLSFRIYSPDGAEWTDLSINTFGDVSSMFDQVDFWQGALTGSIADTVGIKMISGAGTGLPDSFDELLLNLSFTISGSSHMTTICLDTATAASGFDWGWDGLAGCDNIIPGWEGPYCFMIDDYPPHPIHFENAPYNIAVNHCEPASYNFDAVDPEQGSGSDPEDIYYYIEQGPGVINQTTGVWSWDYASDNTPITDTMLIIKAQKANDPCGVTADKAYVPLAISPEENQAPEFTDGCGQYIFARHYLPTQIHLDAEDDCPDSQITMYVVDGDGLNGPLWFDGFTLNYDRDAAVPTDFGQYVITVGVTDGLADGQNCVIWITNSDCRGCGCCGVYNSGMTGNITFDPEGLRDLADVTRLIDHVYISKKYLECPELGNTSGDVEGLVDLADITRLIDHIYISKDETANCQ